LKELIENGIYVNKRTFGSALTKGNFTITCSTLFRGSEMPEDILDNIGDLQPLDFIFGFFRYNLKIELSLGSVATDKSEY